MSPLLYTGIVLYSASDPEASAVLVDGGLIAWIGTEDSARVLFPDVERIDATGCLMAPGFVDAACGDGEDPTVSAEHHALGIVERIPGAPGLRDGVRVVAPVSAMADLLGASREGLPLAFGSDGRREAADPWAWVRAATGTGALEHRISDRAAFLASTRGGLRLSGARRSGMLRTGSEATFVLWEPWDLTVRGQGATIDTWSTDPRSRTPLLPDLDQGSPRALRTVVDGRIVHDVMGQVAGDSEGAAG